MQIILAVVFILNLFSCSNEQSTDNWQKLAVNVNDQGTTPEINKLFQCFAESDFHNASKIASSLPEELKNYKLLYYLASLPKDNYKQQKTFIRSINANSLARKYKILFYKIVLNHYSTQTDIQKYLETANMLLVSEYDPNLIKELYELMLRNEYNVTTNMHYIIPIAKLISITKDPNLTVGKRQEMLELWLEENKNHELINYLELKKLDHNLENNKHIYASMLEYEQHPKIMDTLISAMLHKNYQDHSLNILFNYEPYIGFQLDHIRSSSYQVVLGPLSKQNIQYLKGHKSDKDFVTFNTITDRYPEQHKINNNVFQFGLIPENEIEELMKFLTFQEHKNVLIVCQNSPQYLRELKAAEHGLKKYNKYVQIEKHVVEPSVNALSFFEKIFDIASIKDEFISKDLLIKDTLPDYYLKNEFKYDSTSKYDAIVILGASEFLMKIIPSYKYFLNKPLPLFVKSNNTKIKDIDKKIKLHTVEPINKQKTYDNIKDVTHMHENIFWLGIDATNIAEQIAWFKHYGKLGLQLNTGHIKLTEHNILYRKLKWKIY